MNEQEIVETNKGKILPELYEWAETFDWELDEDGEKTIEPYNRVFSLAERLMNNQSTLEDYKEILFHIKQINHNELKIQL